MLIRRGGFAFKLFMLLPARAFRWIHIESARVGQDYVSYVRVSL